MIDEQIRSIVLQNAVVNGVVDTTIYPFFNPMVAKLLQWGDQKRGPRQNPAENEPFEQIKTARFQAHSYPAELHDPVTNWVAIETARFRVPRGQVGFVDGLEQILVDAGGNYYPTNREYWGSPVTQIPDIDSVRWYLKMDFYDGQEPARLFRSTLAPFDSGVLPGLPYVDMPEIDALWYPANSSQKIRLVIPGCRMIRFYYVSPPTVLYQWRVRGRLTGYTQSVFSPETTDNARRVV